MMPHSIFSLDFPIAWNKDYSADSEDFECGLVMILIW